MLIVRIVGRCLAILGWTLFVVGVWAIWDFSVTARPGTSQLVSVSDRDVQRDHEKSIRTLRLPLLDRGVQGDLHRIDGFFIGVGTVETQTITCHIEVDTIYRDSSEIGRSLVPFSPIASPPYGWSSYVSIAGIYIDKESSALPAF